VKNQKNVFPIFVATRNFLFILLRVEFVSTLKGKHRESWIFQSYFWKSIPANQWTSAVIMNFGVVSVENQHPADEIQCETPQQLSAKKSDALVGRV
jgi:hypothetical protein